MKKPPTYQEPLIYHKAFEKHPLPISVVLCTYNGAKFIKEQLNSILVQTYPVDELIIVDDKSTDETVVIIKSLMAQYPAIRFYENEVRLGVIKNFEKALFLAKNEMIAISDQDDIWHPQKLEKLVANFSENNLLIHCNSIKFTDNPDFSIKPNSSYVRFQGDDSRKFFIANSVSGHAMLLKKKLLRYAFPFQEDVMYDWWIALIASYNGGVQYLPEVLVLQRVHGNNVSLGDKYDYRNPKNRIKFKKTVLSHLHHFMNAPGMPAKDKLVAEKLFLLWKRALNKKMSFELLFFLIKYRRILFSFKKKRTGFFTHLKYSWWFSTNY